MNYSFMPESYITSEFASKTKYKSIKNAYDRNDLSIVVRGGFWYAERCSSKIFSTVKREMNRIFPYLFYAFEGEED